MEIALLRMVEWAPHAKFNPKIESGGINSMSECEFCAQHQYRLLSGAWSIHAFTTLQDSEEYAKLERHRWNKMCGERAGFFLSPTSPLPQYLPPTPCLSCLRMSA